MEKETIELIEEEVGQTTIQDLLGSKLVVFNDDVNSLEWVIACFLKYLKVGVEEAIDFAMQIHTKGQHTVKWGHFEELEPISTALNDAGLNSEVQ